MHFFLGSQSLFTIFWARCASCFRAIYRSFIRYSAIYRSFIRNCAFRAMADFTSLCAVVPLQLYKEYSKIGSMKDLSPPGHNPTHLPAVKRPTSPSLDPPPLSLGGQPAGGGGLFGRVFHYFFRVLRYCAVRLPFGNALSAQLCDSAISGHLCSLINIIYIILQK